MTVIFLARNLVVGGAERALLHYVNQAASYAPVVALLQRSGRLLNGLSSHVPLFDLSARIEEPAFVDPTAVDVEARETGVFSILVAASRLGRVVRKTDADVVSSFLMRSHLVALLAKRFFRLRVPVVLNVHVHVSQSAPFLYRTPFARLMMRFIVRRMFPHADAIVVVARSVKDDLVDTYGIPEAKVQVVYNAIDLAAVRDSATERLELPARIADRPLVVAVGRLVPLKGYDILVRAIAGLPGTPDAGLVVLGEGEEGPHLERLARQLGIEDRVLFPGYVRNPWMYMARADVLAVPSHTEAFPNVIGEALALGVPIVATDCSPGVAEYLRGGELGLLVPPDDVEALSDGLDRILMDAELRTSLTAGGGERVTEFDIGRAVPTYERAIASIARTGL